MKFREVKSSYEDPVTTVTVETEYVIGFCNRRLTATGKAHRSEMDEPNPAVGYELALLRAKKRAQRGYRHLVGDLVRVPFESC